MGESVGHEDLSEGGDETSAKKRAAKKRAAIKKAAEKKAAEKKAAEKKAAAKKAAAKRAAAKKAEKPSEKEPDTIVVVRQAGIGDSTEGRRQRAAVEMRLDGSGD